MTRPSMRREISSTRADRGESLHTVAKLAGITKSHLWDLEQGRATNPTIRTICGLADALHIPFAWLAEGACNDMKTALLADQSDASDVAEELYRRTGGPTEGLKQCYAALLENEAAKKVKP